MAVRVVAFDVSEGTNQADLGTFESVQMTGQDLRSDDDEVILHFDLKSVTWFDMASGRGWYDWTVEQA